MDKVELVDGLRQLMRDHGPVGMWPVPDAIKHIETLEAENAALRMEQNGLIKLLEKERAELAARGPVLSADEVAAIHQALHEMLGMAQDNVPEWREKYITWATALSNLLSRQGNLERAKR